MLYFIDFPVFLCGQDFLVSKGVFLPLKTFFTLLIAYVRVYLLLFKIFWSSNFFWRSDLSCDLQFFCFSNTFVVKFPGILSLSVFKELKFSEKNDSSNFLKNMNKWDILLETAQLFYETVELHQQIFTKNSSSCINTLDVNNCPSSCL